MGSRHGGINIKVKEKFEKEAPKKEKEGTKQG